MGKASKGLKLFAKIKLNFYLGDIFMTLKQIFSRFLFGLELFIFSAFYIFGPNGLLVVSKLKANNKNVLYEIECLQDQVKQLTVMRDRIKSDGFYKEELARNLQMAYPNEDIYPI